MSGVYWPAVAIGVGLAACVPYWTFARGRPWFSIARLSALANLIVVFMNGAAPIRGALDPNYIGYGFGLVTADKGSSVTWIAGSMVVASALAASLAMRGRGQFAMIVVASVCAFHSLNIGLPLIETVMRNPADVQIQFGEYLTVPHTVAIPALFGLLVFPFLLGTAWALNRSFEAE